MQGLVDSAPNDPSTDPAKALARARAVLAAREADIAKCDGIDGVALARTNTNAPALLAWLKKSAPRVDGDWSTAPTMWLDGIPLLTWRHPGICLLNARQMSRAVPFSPGSTAIDAKTSAALTQFLSEAAAYPEFDEWYVKGLDATISKGKPQPPPASHPGIPAAVQRAQATTAWLTSHSFAAKEDGWNNWPPDTDGALLLGAVRNQCGADHVWFK